MSGNPHYFIGIPISEEIRKLLTVWQEDLKQVVQYKTWTHPEDFHITLKFLGAVTEEGINDVKELLKEAAFPRSFETEAADMNFFGQKQKPRVLFMGVKKAPSLIQVKDTVEETLEKAGFPVEGRAYRPHITIAKKWVQGQENTIHPEYFEKFKEATVLPVDRFHIYRIHPKNTPKYEVIETIELG